MNALTVAQSPEWQNWTPVDRVVPENLRDAPVFLALGPKDYWVFGRYTESEDAGFQPEAATLEGFDVPLETTPFRNQYNAPGGHKEGLGGYHAWQSRDGSDCGPRPRLGRASILIALITKAQLSGVGALTWTMIDEV